MMVLSHYCSEELPLTLLCLAITCTLRGLVISYSFSLISYINSYGHLCLPKRSYDLISSQEYLPLHVLHLSLDSLEKSPHG